MHIFTLDTSFNNLWEKLKKETSTLGIEESSLQRKRKRKGKLLSENERQFYFDMEEVEIYYKRVYFDAIDTIVAINLTNRFNQPGFQACQNIEQLLLNAVNNKNYEEQQKNALAVYEHDLDIITLTTWLESLKVNFSSNSYDKHPSKDIIETLKTSSVNFREYFSQVIILLKILLVMTATNAVSERSVSNIRRIKDLLRNR